MARTMLKLAAAALLVSLASGPARPEPAPAPPPLIPAEAFGALPFFTAPEISPDGTRLVAGSVSEGRKAVVLADLTRPDYALARIDRHDKFEMLWARWAGNRRVLMSLVIPTKLYGAEIRTSRLFLFDVATPQGAPARRQDRRDRRRRRHPCRSAVSLITDIYNLLLLYRLSR